MDEYQLAQKLKKPVSEIRKAQDYIKRHPFDHLQKGDPMYEKVWGKKQREAEEKMKKGKRDAEMEYMERKKFEVKNK